MGWTGVRVSSLWPASRILGLEATALGAAIWASTLLTLNGARPRARTDSASSVGSDHLQVKAIRTESGWVYRQVATAFAPPRNDRAPSSVVHTFTADPQAVKRPRHEVRLAPAAEPPQCLVVRREVAKAGWQNGIDTLDEAQGT